MKRLSFKRHRYPAAVAHYAVWLHFRFTLSFCDVEELLAQRGGEVSREAIRCWTIKFGPVIAANLRRRRARRGAAASGRGGGEDRRTTDVSMAAGGDE